MVLKETAAAPTGPDSVIDLRLLGTTDVHAHIHPFDYAANAPTPTLGLSRTALLIAAEREDAANTLLFDNGDFLQGTPLGDYVAEVRTVSAKIPHPMIVAMNQLGYDAGTLGNHEFNYGLAFLRDTLAGADFPFACATIRMTGAAPALCPPTLLLDRVMTDRTGAAHTLRIAVIGLLPPQITVWDQAHLEGQLTTTPIVHTAAACVSAVRAAGADLVVALCHSGLGPDVAPADADPTAEHAALAVARLPGIDAVIAGHSHIPFPDAPETVTGRAPIVLAGYGGAHLGVIDLALARQAAGWRVTGATARLASLAPVAEPVTLASPAILAATAADHDATTAYYCAAAGETGVPLHTYLAQITDAPAVRLIAAAQAWRIAAVLRGTPDAALPLLSAAAPFKAGGRGGPSNYTDIPAGALALRHLADLSPFPNRISALRVTGRTLRDWLIHATSGYLRILPGRQDQPLIDPDFAGYNTDLIDGLTYEIDLSAPPEARIRDLRIGDRPLADADMAILATNSYRASGGGGFPGTGPGAAVVHSGEATIRDILAGYLRETGSFAPSPRPVWRFRPLPGTSVIVPTGAGALRHLGALPATPTGVCQNGFTLLRLTL